MCGAARARARLRARSTTRIPGAPGPTDMATYDGSCHCGAIRFQVSLADDVRDVLDCNCSICTMKGILHLIIDEPSFTLLAGADSVTTYTFGTHTAKHMFCRTCGIHPFYRPRSHPDSWDVNA